MPISKVLVGILGVIDLASASVFLMLVFGMTPSLNFIIFCASLLLLKSLFIFLGDALSFVDLFSSILLFISLLFSLPIVLLWIPAFLLLAKGVMSFF
ncbi:MAG: hypothetical protein AABW75_00410 [Nanoarchaeota archaeon]